MLETVKEQLPEFAKDIRLNLSKVLDLEQSDGLTEQQIIGCALAVAYHLSDTRLIEGLVSGSTDEALKNSAKLAASLMAMTNIYYRFIHLSEDSELSHIPAGLRLQGMMSPGIDKATFEAMSLAVSVLNGCGACISAHCKQLKNHGISAPGLARIGRISAVIHAAHVSLDMP